MRWRLKNADPFLLPVAATLAAVGQMMTSRLEPSLGPRQGVWVLIGLAASRYSIGLGLGLLGVAYAVCAVIPGCFIRERMFDPHAIEDLPLRPDRRDPITRIA